MQQLSLCKLALQHLDQEYHRLLSQNPTLHAPRPSSLLSLNHHPLLAWKNQSPLVSGPQSIIFPGHGPTFSLNAGTVGDVLDMIGMQGWRFLRDKWGLRGAVARLLEEVMTLKKGVPDFGEM